jgi:glycosyltransferase involved in cell wall biosynthesis
MSSPPLRVMLVAATLGFGGAEKHVVTLANSFDAERFRCSVVYLKPDETLLNQLIASRLDAIISLNVQRRIDWRAVAALTGHLDRLAIDVILCATEYPALIALLAARKARRRPKLIEIFHTTVFGTIKGRVQMWLYRRIFRRLDLLVYVSRKQMEYWQSKGLGAKRSVVIHNGIDCEHFRDTYSAAEKATLRARYGFASADFVIGICAALRPEKAHGDLLQALARLRSLSINARCLIIGDGPERNHIESTIAQLGLKDSAAITGFQADVRPLIASCDVIVLASRTVETFSIAALEAMALGKPVVLSRIGGAEELVTDGDNGFLFEAGDVQQLAVHLQALATQSTRLRMGAAARDRVRGSFTESGMVKQYVEQISQTMAQHP